MLLKLILCILILAAAALLESRRERSALKTEFYGFRSAKIRERCRIVFLCDLHGASFGPGNERLIEKVRALKPDLILSGGDLITAGGVCLRPPQKTREVAELVGRLCGICPVILTHGNHETRFEARFPEEYGAYEAALKETGAVLLRNGRLDLEEKGISIYGAEPELRYFRAVHKYMPSFGHLGLRRKLTPMPEDYLEKLLGAAGKDSFALLLLHTPLYLKESAAWGADLVLSGHFHGGTIRVPFLGGLMTPQFQFFLKECSGLHHEKDCTMLVSRGLGTHSVNIRLNDLPEISCIDLLPEAAETAAEKRAADASPAEETTPETAERN